LAARTATRGFFGNGAGVFWVSNSSYADSSLAGLKNMLGLACLSSNYNFYSTGIYCLYSNSNFSGCEPTGSSVVKYLCYLSFRTASRNPHKI
jgi:hypothetical protein